MLKQTVLLFLFAFASSDVGCTQQRNAGGIGGNLIPIAQEPDGTWLHVSIDEYNKMTDHERRRLIREHSEGGKRMSQK